MLNDEVMENLLCHYFMKNFTIEAQAQIMQIFEDVIRQAEEANIYATVSELLSDTDAYISRQLSATDDEYV